MKTAIGSYEPERDPYEVYRTEYRAVMTQVVTVLRKSGQIRGRW